MSKLLSIILLLFLIPLGLSIMIFSVPDVRSGESVDNSIYRELLKKYVVDGVVDYRGFKDEESRLDH